MQVAKFINANLVSLLDVGCNVGAWLQDCRKHYPSARLVGVELNEVALKQARAHVPTAEFFHASAESLPFPESVFDCVTCIEVIEHLPIELRAVAFQEMRRVLKPWGRLILTVPHVGWFGWLDSNNVRFRLPRLYLWLVGSGMRDDTYDAAGRGIEWHKHFSVHEILDLAGEGWELVAVRRGGLLLYPLMDWLSWPFYRLGKPEHPIRVALERLAGWDYSIDFGHASYGIMVVLTRLDVAVGADLGAREACGTTITRSVSDSKSSMP